MIQVIKKWWNALGTDRRWSLRFVGKETLIYREGDHELDFIHTTSQNFWDFELVAWRWNSHKSEVIADEQRTLITERVKTWLAKNGKGRTLQFNWPV